MDNPFTSYPHRHRENIEESRLTHSRPGILQNPNGAEEPAIIVFRDRFCLAVLTPDDAVRLSNEIIDAIESPAC